MYACGDPKPLTASAECFSKLGTPIDGYVYKNMWAGPPVSDGIYDVEEGVTGMVRTDGPIITFNGAWAQNIGENEMFIDFLGDKCGARLNYGGKFELYDGETLETITPEYDIPNMYLCEDRAFMESITNGEKNRNHIQYILESAKLLDALYQSSQLKKEVTL